MLQVLDRGYKDHLGRVISGKMPVANQGDKGTYWLDYEVYFGFSLSFSLSMSISNGSSIMMLSGANWADFGITAGDTMYVVNAENIDGSYTTNGSYNVMLVDGNKLVNSGAFTGSDSYIAGEVYVIKSPQSVKSNIALIPKDQDSGLGSLIDSSSLTVVNNNIGGMNVSDALTLDVIGNRSGGGLVSATIIRLADTRGGKAKSYRIEYIFYWSYYLSNLAEFFFDLDCVTPYVFSSFMPIWNNPSVALSGGFKPIGDGNSGFRDENFNQNPNNFVVESMQFADSNNSIIAGFDYSVPTKFQITINDITGNGFGALAGFIMFNDIEDRDLYSSTTTNNNGDYSHLQNTIFAEFASIQVGGAVVTFDSYVGKNGEKLSFSVEADIVAGKLIIEGIITPNSQFTALFDDEQNTNKRITILARTESATFPATNYSDTVNLLAWSGDAELAPIPDQPYNGMKQVGFLNHTQVVTDIPDTTHNSCTEDDLIFKALMDLDNGVIWESIRIIAEVERISDGLKFTLESHIIDLSDVGIIGGVMQIDKTININQYLDAPVRNKINFKNTGVTSVGKYEALMTWSAMVNWRYWRTQTNALNDFFDVSIPNNGKNQEWIRYLQLLGYRINAKAVLVKEGVGYYMLGRLNIQDYDDSIDIVSTFEFYDETNVQRTSLISGQKMLVRAIHTNLTGAWNMANVWGWIAERGFESDPRKQISTVWNWTAQNAPFKPKVGELKATMTQPSPNVLHVEALVDTNQMTGNKFTFVSRIQDPAIEEPNRCTHPFIVFFDRMNEIYLDDASIENDMNYLLMPVDSAYSFEKKGYSTNMCCSSCATPLYDTFGEHIAFGFGNSLALDSAFTASCCINAYNEVNPNACNNQAIFDQDVEDLKLVVDYSSDPNFFTSNNITVVNDFAGMRSIRVLTQELINFTPNPFIRFKILKYMVTDGFIAKCYTAGGIDISKTPWGSLQPLNFDVTANWNLALDSAGVVSPVTDETSFRQFLTNGANGNNNLTNIIINSFSLVGGRLRCYLEANGTTFDISYLSATNLDGYGDVNYFTKVFFSGNTSLLSTVQVPSTIKELYYNNCNKNTLPLGVIPPSTFELLDYSNNNMTLSGYTSSEAIASTFPVFTSPCTMIFSSNPDSITGTNLETILLTKNVIIIA